ncbi:MAG: ABC transporter ATP-binding protein, partial [Candidatus Competibacterales bacterium]|nr:ABC transporter ATP-binding protein [Candidatus Competibacterales bacterium]
MNRLPPLLAEGRAPLLARLIFWGLLQAAVLVVTVLLVRRTFDALFAAEPSVTPWAAGLTLLGLALAGLRVLTRVDAERLGQHYIASVRDRLFRRVLALSQRQRQQRRLGHLMLRFIGDLSALRNWVSQGLAQLLVAGLTMSTTVAVLAALNIRLALAVSLILLLTLGAILLLGPALTRRIRRARRQRARLAANLGEKLRAADTVQACGRQRREQRRVRADSERLRAALVARAQLASLVRQLPEAANGLALAAVVLLGLRELAAGTTTPGTLVAVITVTGLMTRPLAELARLFDYRQNYRVARDKIERFLALQPLDRPSRQPHSLPAAGGRLELDGLSVRGALHELSAVAEAGEIVAVVGPNGAGKTTLLAAAARLIPADGGRVRLDGRDLARCRRSALSRAIGIASAELPLVKGSIDRNIRYRLPSADADEVARVCALTGLDQALARLPRGFDTRLGEHGRGIATGLRQRILLARALLGHPSLLLLDEIDAALDSPGRAQLDRLLRERPATVLIITHDPARLRRADRIWHLAGGRLIEQGPPATLLAG